MKTVKFAIAALSLVTSVSFAQSISATAATIDDAEAQIAQQARQADASYKITEAFNGNQVHMTAELQK
ncbi:MULTISPECIES: YdgH/BhsA/McbA-like domain containing protein [Franconibacter]|uniref:YdgH/BhsA/McbA-like domain-containing protein n=1 Tax=Franconibacter pulveris TaxID=435910 RepID=A0A0J8VIG0_9ENTR|nr:YdgH/BhsA/McbA-like domain containing protein [Franconibacter pulveris]KMV32902.1 hypothetical protein ACH50_19415 [Franconibacter pulveris]